MKRRTKWILGLSAAGMLATAAAALLYIMAVISAISAQAVFHRNGWSMIDDDWEAYMGYISRKGISEDEMSYGSFLEHKDELLEGETGDEESN